MIHIADITREKRLNHPKEALAAGQDVKAQVLEVDVAKRRIRLGMKQLEPTSVDNYIAEHQAGETVSGRILEVGTNKVRVELGEGVVANCRISPEQAPEKQANREKVDVSAMSAMLTQRWKTGGGAAEKEAAPKKDVARPGQIRSFKIVSLNPEQKKIELEFVS